MSGASIAGSGGAIATSGHMRDAKLSLEISAR
jgi:hypothetical protein